MPAKQSKGFNIVLNNAVKNEKGAFTELSAEPLRNYLLKSSETRLVTFYAFIIHDKDLGENGNPKRPHVHLVIEFAKKRTEAGVRKDLEQLGYFVQSDLLGLEAPAVKYLIHSNAKDKAEGKLPYERTLIESNDQRRVDRDLRQADLTAEEIGEKISSHEWTTRTDALNDLGMVGYQSNLRAINSLLPQETLDVSELRRRLRTTINAYNRLQSRFKDLRQRLKEQEEKIKNIEGNEKTKDNIIKGLEELLNESDL